MKIFVTSFVMLLSGTSFAQSPDSIRFDTKFTNALINYLVDIANAGGDFSIDVHQGQVAYGAEVECPIEQDPMICYVRPSSGFSLDPKPPVQLPAQFARTIEKLMEEHGGFDALRNSYFILTGVINCVDNGGTDANINAGRTVTPNECWLQGP